MLAATAVPKYRPLSAADAPNVVPALATLGSTTASAPSNPTAPARAATRRRRPSRATGLPAAVTAVLDITSSKGRTAGSRTESCDTAV
ncbi:hypothetical protein GCM10027184_03910 [Saccharothrix stipae]